MCYYHYFCFILCRLSGLIIDVFGDLAVVASSAAWVEKYKAEIEDCVRGIEEINHVKWRPSVDILKEEGIDVSELKDTSPSTCPERTKVENHCNICISSRNVIKYHFMGQM